MTDWTFTVERVEITGSSSYGGQRDLLMVEAEGVVQGSVRIALTVQLDDEDRQAFHALWQRAAAKTLKQLKALGD